MPLFFPGALAHNVYNKSNGWLYKGLSEPMPELNFPKYALSLLSKPNTLLGEGYLHRKSICLHVVSPWHTYPSGSIHKLLAWSWNPIVNLSHWESPGLCVMQMEHERTCLRHLSHVTVSSLLSAKGSHGCGNIIWGSFYSRWMKFHLSCWKRNWEFSHSCNQNQR